MCFSTCVCVLYSLILRWKTYGENMCRFNWQVFVKTWKKTQFTVSFILLPPVSGTIFLELVLYVFSEQCNSKRLMDQTPRPPVLHPGVFMDSRICDPTDYGHA